MATHSSTLAWKIPWTEEPNRLQSMGSQRVQHDWATWKKKKKNNSSSIFNCLRISIVFSIMTSLWVYKGSLFSTPSPIIAVCCLWDNSQSDRCEVISVWFWLAFPWWLVMFSYVCWHWYVIFGKKCLFCRSINFLIKSCVFGFFDVELHRFYVYFGH